MREIGTELKALKLYGMAGAWSELSVKGIDSSRWLIEQLLDAESTDRAMRSIRWQMSSARFRFIGTWRASALSDRVWIES